MKYKSLIIKINLFEKIAQDTGDSPYTMQSEKDLFGEGNTKKNIEVPNEYLKNLMMDSHTKYNNLTPEEKKAIDWWVGSSDSIKNPNHQTQQLAQKFSETLGKFQINNPTEKHPLIRRFRATESELRQMFKRGEITLKDNTSASYKSIDKFGPNEFIFKYVSKAYSLLGPNYSEAEMIIPRGTKFKILNHKQNNKGGYTIELTEIN